MARLASITSGSSSTTSMRSTDCGTTSSSIILDASSPSGSITLAGGDASTTGTSVSVALTFPNDTTGYAIGDGVIDCAAATYTSVTVGNTAGDTTVGVSIGTLAAAGSVTITFDVTVDSPFPAGTTTVANQGLVTGDGGISVPTNDPDTVPAGDPTVTPVEDPGVEAEKTDVLAIDAGGTARSTIFGGT